MLILEKLCRPRAKMERGKNEGFSVFKLFVFVTVLVELKFDVNADFENSWTMYMEQPCCSGTGSHHVRHHRGALGKLCCWYFVSKISTITAECTCLVNYTKLIRPNNHQNRVSEF